MKRKEKEKKYRLKFSICMPAYNGAEVIGPTLKSILSQSFDNYELIIIDDCSKDETEKVVKSFRDERIKYFKNQSNLGYSLNLEECRKKAKGDIVYLMGQDDILGRDALLNTYKAFMLSEDIGAVTRPYFWFDKDINKPVRAKEQLDPRRDELLTINSEIKKIIVMFSTLDQLSGLAMRRKYIDTPFHKDIFPCHVYPFASIFKKHPIVFLKDYNLAVRIGSSQCRSPKMYKRKTSYIYDKSPVQSWVDMFNNVFYEEKFKELRKYMIRNFVAVNYVGLIQIRNYAKYRYLLREIWMLLKHRWQNIFNLPFWFFSLGCVIMPPFLLIPLVDWYKRDLYSQKFRGIKFYYKTFHGPSVNKPKISIIIPTYNRKKDLIEYIRSIKKSTYKNIEIIVVDNASTDGTTQTVEKLFPDVKIIKSKVNLDAAGGRNLGIKNVGKESSYFLFLDDDVVIEPDTIIKLYEAINDKPEYAAATGKILYYEKPTVVQLAGSSVGLFTGLNYANTGPDDGRFDEPCDCFAGGAMLIKRQIAERVGFYDEIYPRLYEDADYSARIIHTGKKILYVPGARIYHKASILDRESATNRWLSSAYRTARNKIIFMRKHSPCFLCFLLLYPTYLLFYTYQAIRFYRIDALLNFYKGTFAGFKWAFFNYKNIDSR